MITILSVQDLKSQTFAMPIFVPSVAAGTRSFLDAINDPSSGTLHNHPADFNLYKLGTYDDDKGIITPLDVPQLVFKGTASETQPS